MEIQVSIICNAYNHEAYIRDALNGFIMQKTAFPFEVLVHDDASADRTADIIREYEKNYPDIIKPIYEAENQYSKHDGSLGRIQYGRAKGKYIAVCEGDDYWTDPLKLQKQFDLLEAHPEIDICATEAATEAEGHLLRKVTPAPENTIFSVQEVIDGGGGFVATASLMYRAAIRQDPPRFYQKMQIDYFLQIWGALRGGMLYIAEPTCVYRLQTPGSWTVRTYKSIETMNIHQKELCDALQCLDDDTERKYHHVIEEKIKDQIFAGLVRNRKYKDACSMGYKSRFKKLPRCSQLLLWVGKYFPGLANLIKDFRQRKNKWQKKT